MGTAQSGHGFGGGLGLGGPFADSVTTGSYVGNVLDSVAPVVLVSPPAWRSAAAAAPSALAAALSLQMPFVERCGAEAAALILMLCTYPFALPLCSSRRARCRPQSGASCVPDK